VEAGAHGKPVLAGRSGGMPEAVIEGVTGVLVNGSNVAEIRGALVALMQDPSLRAQLGENARRHVQEHFNRKTQAQRMKEAWNLAPLESTPNEELVLR
jgi:phosphatidyl-myo-inositol dimannoside synthase